MSENSVILLKDTIPESFPGVLLNDKFGCGIGFTFDEVLKNDLYFQIQPFIQILKDDNKEILFEYRLLCNYFFKYKMEDVEFYPEAYKLNLVAINEFDKKIKLKKSTLTFFKSFTPIPSFEQAKDHIRKAYILLDYGRGSKN